MENNRLLCRHNNGPLDDVEGAMVVVSSCALVSISHDGDYATAVCLAHDDDAGADAG